MASRYPGGGARNHPAVSLRAFMRASIVIRARDEAAAIGRTLERLAAQTVAHEVVVVDHASRDATARIARDAGARVIGLDAFTFGGALNAGAAACSAPLIVALSAHAVPRDREWLARMVGAFDDAAVACASGDDHTPSLRQDAAALRANPYVGYSNGAGGFRAELWRRRPFREDLPGCEDREWALWALEQGYVCRLDPALAVDHDHSGDSLRASFARYEREARGYRMFLELPPYGARDALGEWWGDQGWHRSRARARLDPRRAARLVGKWWGSR
jgi:rhamnosyltransferase